MDGNPGRARARGPDARLAALARAMHDLLDEALTDPDEIEAFRRAEAILQAAEGVRGRAAKVKARIVLRMWQPGDRRASYTAIGQKLGISKQRTKQLADRARQLEQGEGPAPGSGDTEA